MVASLVIKNVWHLLYHNFFQVKNFVKFAQEQAQYYTSNNIILTMGDDFTYQDAAMYFKNLDKLVK